MKKPLILVCLCSFIGCGTPAHFIPYVGQQKAWRTTAGGLVEVEKYVLPLYYGFPERPYMILGSIVTTQDIAAGVQEAKQHGADAVLFHDSETHSTGGIYLPGQSSAFTSGTVYNHSWTAHTTTHNSPGLYIPTSATTTYLVAIRFINSTIADLTIDDLNTWIQWAKDNPNGADLPNAKGGTVHYSREDVAQVLAGAEKRRAILQENIKTKDTP